MSVNNQKVLVTGGASGIGYAIARKFAEQGASVHVCDINDALIAELNAADNGIRGSVADAGDELDVDVLFESVLNAFDGRLDVLVNNAGIAGPTGPLEKLELDAWLETLRVNVIGTFLCSRRAIPVMKKQSSGAIVNLSSTAGLFGFPARTPYAAAKWGIIGLTKSLAMEVGSSGIRVNAICPGSVTGPRMERVIQADAESRGLDEDVVYEQYLRQVSIRSFVEMDDIAEMTLFICSAKGAKISGQAITVDGHTESLSQGA